MQTKYRTTGARLLLCGLILLLASLPMLAQGAPEGRISGIVKDPTGAVVAGATITAINDATAARFTAKASSEGGFLIPSLTPGSYTVEIVAQGFASAHYTQVMVATGKEYSLTATLKVGRTAETVEVTAGQELVNTTSSEISRTVTTQQIQNLPLLGRDIITMVRTQAGVISGFSARATTSINGARPSWSQVTLDGINIQDLYIRTNALDYIPNRPTTDTVSEFTLTTGTQGADVALGASGVRMVTPSGGNTFHGAGWEYNRHSVLAANSWSRNNTVPVTPNPYRNRNEFGGKLGGPVIKNKLFFYGYYVGIRDRQMSSRNLTIPANDDYTKGVFRYVRPSDQTVQTVNIIDVLPGVTLDPKIQSAVIANVPKASNVNNFNVGNSNSSRLLNTAGYLINQSNNYDRDNWGFKVDYDLNSRHHFDATWSHMHEVTQRPDIDTFNVNPFVYNDSTPKLFTGAYRWTVTDRLINTFRAGLNLTNAPFINDYKNPNGWFVSNIGGLSNPQVTFKQQGRNSNAYQYMDDANWMKGTHNISFGGSYQAYRVNSWNDVEITPTYATGFSVASPSAIQLKAANFPGGSISSTDLSSANALRAFLGGVITSSSQRFNVATKTSGYVAGQGQERELPLNDLMFYAQDRWRVRPNLTLSYGVKWEYLSPYKEVNGLAVGAVYTDKNNPRTTLMDPNGKVDFLGDAWSKDLNNFGPAVGFAWDPFKNGKTSIRGGYTMTFVNDDVYRFAGNAADGNAGLNTGVRQTGLYATFAGGVPAVSTPAFFMPRTYADQLALSTGNVVWALDPNARIPHVHEISFGVQRELPGDMSVEVRYVGTLGRELLRGFDLNQNNAGTNTGFLADFARARSNGYLSQAAGKGFNPAYNSTVAGSQALTYIPTITSATNFLTFSSVVTYLQQNAAADLANFYVTNRATFPNAPSLFLPNPGIYAVDYGTNGAFSSYHGLQVEVNRRYKSGFSFQSSYVWSKNLSDSPGDTGQTRFDPLLDNARPWLAKARSNYDLAQALKGNFIYELPFGKGKRWMSGANGFVDRVLGGWQISSIASLTSGNPFTIYSDRGTFNRSARSGYQTAVSTLTQEQIKQHLGVYRAPSGQMYFIDPTLIDPTTGRAVAPDTLTQAPATNFNQVFFNPTAGGIGNIGLMAFESPAFFNIDLGLMKQVAITERINTKVRMDMFNAPNHPTFWFTDQSINSTNFGKITSTNTSSRVIQLSLRVEF